MKYDRPIVISIAGFDPTGGAGVLADIKTFEQFGCLGMAVMTGNTSQTESDFISVSWCDKETITNQLIPLLKTYEISAVKIGIVENLDMLAAILGLVKASFPFVPVVWDPVLSASSGFQLHESWNEDAFHQVLKQVSLITPNVTEARYVTKTEDEIEAAFLLAQHTQVLLKGGHSTVRQGVDLLFEGGIPREIPPGSDTKSYFPKHGSGCILSAGIAAGLASGKEMLESCQAAKAYIEKRLTSNEHLLSYHAQ